jgi:hypothetical protein
VALASGFSDPKNKEEGKRKRFPSELKHSKNIEITAWHWYQCRVVYEGPTAYYYKQLKQTTPEYPVVVEPENLVHELKEFDEALGYPKENQEKENGWT